MSSTSEELRDEEQESMHTHIKDSLEQLQNDYERVYKDMKCSVNNMERRIDRDYVNILSRIDQLDDLHETVDNMANDTSKLQERAVRQANNMDALEDRIIGLQNHTNVIDDQIKGMTKLGEEVAGLRAKITDIENIQKEIIRKVKDHDEQFESKLKIILSMGEKAERKIIKNSQSIQTHHDEVDSIKTKIKSMDEVIKKCIRESPNDNANTGSSVGHDIINAMAKELRDQINTIKENMSDMVNGAAIMKQNLLDEHNAEMEAMNRKIKRITKNVKVGMRVMEKVTLQWNTANARNGNMVAAVSETIQQMQQQQHQDTRRQHQHQTTQHQQQHQATQHQQQQQYQQHQHHQRANGRDTDDVALGGLAIPPPPTPGAAAASAAAAAPSATMGYSADLHEKQNWEVYRPGAPTATTTATPEQQRLAAAAATEQQQHWQPQQLHQHQHHQHQHQHHQQYQHQHQHQHQQQYQYQHHQQYQHQRQQQQQSHPQAQDQHQQQHHRQQQQQRIQQQQQQQTWQQIVPQYRTYQIPENVVDGENNCCHEVPPGLGVQQNTQNMIQYYMGKGNMENNGYHKVPSESATRQNDTSIGRRECDKWDGKERKM